MADTNRLNYAFVVESTFATVPAGPPTLKNLRVVSEDIALTPRSVTSQELIATRNIRDAILVGAQVAGPLVQELAYGASDELFEYGMQANSTFSSALDFTINSASDTITIAAVGSTFTLTTTTASWVTLGLGAGTADAGKWVLFGSTTNPWTAAGNNGFAKIVSVGGTGNKVLTVQGLAMTAGTQTVGTVAIRRCSDITNGTLQKSILIERTYTDVASTFEVLLGLVPNTWGLDLSLGAIAKVNWNFLGKTEQPGAATVGTGSNTAVPTNDVMQTVTNLRSYLEGYTPITLTNFKCDFNNNLRAREEQGSFGPTSIGAGSFEVKGSFDGYFTAAQVALKNKMRNWTASSFSVVIRDSAGNAYILDLPRTRITVAKSTGEAGLNSDVTGKYEFQAVLSPTELITARLVRSAAN